MLMCLLGSSAATTLAVPEMSYSSSEGEDDFYDANDAPFTPGSHAPSPLGVRSFSHDDESPSIRPSTAIGAVTAGSNRTSFRQDSVVSKKSFSEIVDYDALYEEYEEDDVEMETQGSVIKHLLSQVKIGMDLTKVVLPTFILERRSLLEMYADFFAHPDIFVRIAELKSPKERMLQVVRWYLSSFHAGRKSAVAKKPYNPVLGEVFRCYWDIPTAKEDGDADLVNDGPIPWANNNQLTFLAEQVSHHPPISAFYGEHYNKRISFNAHIYTKSKFLGLSICVYNIGQGVVSVLDYDEEYVVTFPNGYGRSILTIPWIELGGATTITCQKTGYYSNIEFLTKPFYGNKKNKINADVFGPDDRKPFLSVAGEWNGVMEAKWADKEKPEPFIDVHSLSIVHKQVRPISRQEENESRKIWKEVTRSLKFNEIEKASNAKVEIEQRQREEAKERKFSNIEWETKLFQKVAEETWMYLKPLQQRLSQSSNT